MLNASSPVAGLVTSAHDVAASLPFQPVYSDFGETASQRAVGKWQVSTSGGTQARWRPDGKELYYLSPDSKLMGATIEEKSAALEIGNPQILFQVNLSKTTGLVPYDVAPDGKKFVFITPRRKQSRNRLLWSPTGRAR
jgi:hypothetical protein